MNRTEKGQHQVYQEVIYIGGGLQKEKRDTSPRDAEGAVSLPLPRETPSLEMFSNGVDMLSLIENMGVLRLVGCGNQSWVI